MIAGRFLSIQPDHVSAFRAKQIEAERARRPKYGLGTHIPGNKHPGKYRGGHKYRNAIREPKTLGEDKE